MIEPTTKNIRLTCPKCNKISYIEWNDVTNIDQNGTYCEFLCPNCKNRYAVYTKESIDKIKSRL